MDIDPLLVMNDHTIDTVAAGNRATSISIPMHIKAFYAYPEHTINKLQE